MPTTFLIRAPKYKKQTKITCCPNLDLYYSPSLFFLLLPPQRLLVPLSHLLLGRRRRRRRLLFAPGRASTLASPLDMDDYAPMDPYSRTRYEHGIDSKIVIMGNSGQSSIATTISSRLTPSRRCWQDKSPATLYTE